MSDLFTTRGAACVERRPISDIQGTVGQFEDTNIGVTVTNSGGVTKQLATKATANMKFDDGSKKLPADDKMAQSVTVNESFIFLSIDNVLPNHDITDGGSNESVTYSSA